MSNQVTIDTVNKHLQLAIETNLLPEVVCKAMCLVKENPELSIENAFGYAIAEILK